MLSKLIWKTNVGFARKKYRRDPHGYSNFKFLRLKYSDD